MNKLFGHTFVLAVLITVISAVSLAAQKEPFKLTYKYAALGFSSSQRFSHPSGLYYDASRDELYVADTGNGQIVILDNKGMPVTRIQHHVAGSDARKEQRGEPKSVVVCKNGDILVTDNLCGYVDVLDFQGRSVEKFWPADLFGMEKSKVRPGSLAVDTSGNIYVSVSGDVNSILVLTPDKKLKAEIGKVSGSSGAFKAVTGLWVDGGGNIYATYAQGECVRIYAPDGKELASFGSHESGPDNFSLPSGVVTDARKEIWAVDTLRHVVTVFKQEQSGSGLKISYISMPLGGFGSNPGDLAYPNAIAGDGSSRIFVLEGTGARVQAFDVSFEDSTPATR